MSRDRPKSLRFWIGSTLALAVIGGGAHALALALGIYPGQGPLARSDRLAPATPTPVAKSRAVAYSGPTVNRAGKGDYRRRPVRTAQIPPPPPARPAANDPLNDPKAIDPPASQAPALSGRPLGRFYAALTALESGLRQNPVTILHIGDSHISSDAFSRGLRRRLQQRFGDAGRGMVVPAGAYKYAIADGLTLKRQGGWRAYNSLRHKRGPYGLSGVRLVSNGPRARISMTAKGGAFDWAEVTVATGPREGRVRLTAGGRTRMINARAARPGARTVRVAAQARTVTVTAEGGGRTTVFNWATGADRPGIRYVNLGLAGATALITKRWNKALIDKDVRAVAPQLIVFGFGTNEGFNDGLDIKAYRRHVAALLDRFKAAAPNAELLIIGPADSARRPRFGQAKTSGCSVLPAGANYRTLVRRKSSRLARWHAPPKLALVRRTLRDIARQRGAGYWDWAKAMGGPCAVQKWATARPRLAAADRVHLTQRGYDRSAALLIDHLFEGLAQSRRIAQRQ